MAALPPLGNPNPKLADALKQLSAAKYGRPRATVEAEIFERMSVKEEAKPVSPFAAGPAVQPASSSAANQWQKPVSPPPAAGGSFLDEWLSKRPAVAASSAPAAAPAAQINSVTPASIVPSSPMATAPTGMPMAAPQPIAPIADPHNISSEELDKQEVGKIADELKRSLGVTEATVAKRRGPLRR